MDRTVDNRGLLTEPSFYHPAFEQAFQYIINEYPVPPKDTCIFLPCSMQKPFSKSPSHVVFDKVIFGEMDPGDVHIVVFGTCGVVPRELEQMYPFTHYRYMFGKCTDPRIKRDFYEIETYRLTRDLEKTAPVYRRRIAYCLGGFRKAMKMASERTGITVDLLPTEAAIMRYTDNDLRFPEGSLHMEHYLLELSDALRNTVI